MFKNDTSFFNHVKSPKNIECHIHLPTHVSCMCAIDRNSYRADAHVRTSCINFEKCYFSELTIYFKGDEAPLDQSYLGARRKAYHVPQRNKIAIRKVMLRNSIFRNCVFSLTHKIVSSFILYEHVHVFQIYSV